MKEYHMSVKDLKKQKEEVRAEELIDSCLLKKL